MRPSVLFALVLPTVAFATAIPRGYGGSGGNCNTGQIKCCNSVQDAKNVNSNILGGLLGGIGLGSITGLVGLNCTPLNIIGLGGNSCSAQPACCTGNDFSGLVTLGCTPINLNA